MIPGKVDDLPKPSVVNQVIASFKVPVYIPATSKGHILTWFLIVTSVAAGALTIYLKSYSLFRLR